MVEPWPIMVGECAAFKLTKLEYYDCKMSCYKPNKYQQKWDFGTCQKEAFLKDLKDLSGLEPPSFEIHLAYHLKCSFIWAKDPTMKGHFKLLIHPHCRTVRPQPIPPSYYFNCHLYSTQHSSALGTAGKSSHSSIFWHGSKCPIYLVFRKQKGI